MHSMTEGKFLVLHLWGCHFFATMYKIVVQQEHVPQCWMPFYFKLSHEYIQKKLFHI